MTVIYANDNEPETFFISKDSGEVTIIGSNCNDSIEFENLDGNVEWIHSWVKKGNDLVITRNATSKVILKDYFLQDPSETLYRFNENHLIKDFARVEINASGKINGTYLNDTIYGSAGNDTILASEGRDDIFAGKGNDVIYTSKEGSHYHNYYSHDCVYGIHGEQGNDKIYISQRANNEVENIISYSLGDGNDSIYNATAQDVIEFSNIDKNQVLYNKVGEDLVISYKPTNAKMITLVDYFGSNSDFNRLRFLSYEGNNFETSEVLLDNVSIDIKVTNGNDTLSTFSDTGAQIAGLKGNDKIYITQREVGKEFKNVITYNLNDGSDSIYGATSYDSINFNGVDENKVSYDKIGNDLVISLLPKKTKMITLVDYFDPNNSDKLNSIKFSPLEGESDVEEVLLSNTLINAQGKTGTDIIIAPDGFDCLITPSKESNILNLYGEGEKIVKISEGQGRTEINMDNNTEKVIIELTSKYEWMAYQSFGRDVATGKDLIIYHYGLNTKIDDFYVTDEIVIKNYFDGLTGENIEFKFNNQSPVVLSNSFFEGYKFQLHAQGTTLNGTVESDHIMAGNGNIEVIAGDGDDLIDTGLLGNKRILSGNGDDEIFVTNFEDSVLFVYDTQGTDTITINGFDNGSNVNVFFDIGRTSDVILGSPNLFLLKNIDIMSFIQDKINRGVIEIADYFDGKKYYTEEGQIETSGGGGKIENFVVGDGNSLDVESYISRVEKEVKEWFDLEGHEHYNSVFEVVTGPSAQHRKEILEIYTKQPAKVILNPYASFEYDCTKRNDFIETTESCTVNSGNGHDKILCGKSYWYYDAPPAGNYNLNGGNGNDILEAGENTTITGGAGENVIKVSGTSSVLITQGKGKDYIHFTDGTINDVVLEKAGNDLNIVVGEAKATIANYFKYLTKSCIKGIAFSDVVIDYENEYALDIVKKVKENVTNSTILELLNNPSNKLKLIGTYSADKLTGTKYSDLILAGEGRDTITAGLGSNVLEYNEEDGSDIINLTKGENFTLHLKDVHDESDLYFEIDNKKDVLVYTSNGEFITFNGLAKKDITNNATKKLEDKSSVLVQYEDALDETHYIDLRKDITYGIEATGNYTGTWLNEEIYGCLDTPGKKNLGLMLKGGNGNDIIHGTFYNDKIYGDNGNDKVDAGSGDDTIYATAGNDTIEAGKDNDVIYLGKDETTLVFYNGDGHDTIYMDAKDKIEDKLQFMDTNYSEIKSQVDGNDMILWHDIDGEGNYQSSVRIKNWLKIYDSAKNKIPMLNKIYNSLGQNWAQEDIAYLCRNYIDNNEKASKTINGSKVKDIISGKADFAEIIKCNADNDTVNGGSSSGKDTVYGGDGKDFIDYEASVDTVYLDGQTGDDEIRINYGTAIGGLGEDTIRVNVFSKGVLIYGDIANDKKQIKGDNDKIYGGYGGRDNEEQIGGDTIYAGGGDDTIYGYGGSDVIYGGNGNDLICTSFDVAVKNETYNVETQLYGGNGNDTIYAISEQNTVFGDGGNDIFYTYIDQRTTISDSSGVDELNILDANHSDLVLRFNVSRNYKAGNVIKDIEIADEYRTTGVLLKTNSIETIKTADSYTITSADIALMAQDIASWLKNTNYIDVNDAFENCGNTEYEQLSAIFSKESYWKQA